MSSDYFSTLECAGGCGNLLPQRIVDLGRRYLHGHKSGCPAEGESYRRKPKSGAAAMKSDVGNTKPSAAVVTSYEATLKLTEAGIETLRGQLVELYDSRERAQKACGDAEDKLARLYKVQDALLAALGKPPAALTDEVAEEGMVA